MRKILIVEDDGEIRKLLSEYLADKGFEVLQAAQGKEASERIRKERFDVILMDMMLPFISGDMLIKQLRGREDDPKAAKTPVIVISARSGVETRIEMLKMGADDYIIKPFNLDEVLVRIEAVLRRSADGAYADGGQTASNKVLSCGPLECSVAEHRVTYEGTPIKLTAKEMSLLAILMESPQKTFSKANLYESVWQEPYVYEDNTVNVHMSNLRSKLKSATGRDFIETVWGIGYKLKAHD